VEGERFEQTLPRLVDLGVAAAEPLRRFAGSVTYAAEFAGSARDDLVLDLGRVHGVSEVQLNGTPLGSRWWGRHRYALGDTLREGPNRLEVRVATVVFNHARHSEDPVARAWVRSPDEPEPVGLVGPVTLLQPRAPARSESAR